MPYQKGSKWIAQVRKTTEEGQEHRKEKIFQTKKEAKNWEAKMQRTPVEEWNGKTTTTSLGDWAQIYLDYAKSRFCIKTYMEKRLAFRLFFREIENTLPVKRLSPSDVLNHVLKQKEARSGYAANKDRKNLVAAWNWGMKYMSPPLPGPNPCLVERMPEVRQPRYVPPEEDFWKVYSAATGQDQVMLLTFLHLAARRGEIFRMEWSDVDWGNSRVRLWTRKRKDGTYEYDWLPMTNELRTSLRWWWEHRPIKDSPSVFLCLEDSPFTRKYFGKPFLVRLQFMRRLCKKAKVQRFGFHAIRHLSASILFNAGYDLGVIQCILRHRSPSTTERYLKSIGLERVRDALESLPTGPAEVIPIDQVKEKGAGVEYG